jgi:hypothetical protein
MDDAQLTAAANERRWPTARQLQRDNPEAATGEDATGRTSRLEATLFDLARVADNLDAAVLDLTARLAHVTAPATVPDDPQLPPAAQPDLSPSLAELDRLGARLARAVKSIGQLRDRLDV